MVKQSIKCIAFAFHAEVIISSSDVFNVCPKIVILINLVILLFLSIRINFHRCHKKNITFYLSIKKDKFSLLLEQHQKNLCPINFFSMRSEKKKTFHHSFMKILLINVLKKRYLCESWFGASFFTTTTLTRTFSGKRTGARNWRAKATSKCKMDTIFFECTESTLHFWTGFGEP